MNTTINVRIDSETKDHLDLVGSRIKKNVSTLLREIIADYLDDRRHLWDESWEPIVYDVSEELRNLSFNSPKLNE
ncbi:hypothetical protein [Bizionia paragorgiae]|uniref:hypothetical protein n=1 Tax=Bizionia paragorgiae TaxID=283786 RepID=UPI00299D4B84|nr:hypothetical protein [Bizionia paragorgiae]MDX1271924.1 hypothetical protein [Bizionia paragorgiae]